MQILMLPICSWNVKTRRDSRCLFSPVFASASLHNLAALGHFFAGIRIADVFAGLHPVLLEHGAVDRIEPRLSRSQFLGVIAELGKCSTCFLERRTCRKGGT